MARSRALRFAAALGLALAFTGPVSATPPTEAQVDRFIEALGIRNQYTHMQQQVLDAMERRFRAEFPNPTPEEQRAINQLLTQVRDRLFTAIAWDKVAPVYRRIFLQQYTSEEIEAAIAYFTSPEGASLVRKQPLVMDAAMREIEPLVTGISQSIIEDAMTESERPPTRKP
jgi:hypothetical protein